MTPLTEFYELVRRSRSMLDAILLAVLSFLLLVVALATCFCAVCISVFTTGRRVIDRQAARIKAPKEATT